MPDVNADDATRYAEWCGEGSHDEPETCRALEDCVLHADDGVCATGWECAERQQREAERVHENRSAVARMERDT